MLWPISKVSQLDTKHTHKQTILILKHTENHLSAMPQTDSTNGQYKYPNRNRLQLSTLLVALVAPSSADHVANIHSYKVRTRLALFRPLSVHVKRGGPTKPNDLLCRLSGCENPRFAMTTTQSKVYRLSQDQRKRRRNNTLVHSHHTKYVHLIERDIPFRHKM